MNETSRGEHTIQMKKKVLEQYTRLNVEEIIDKDHDPNDFF